jgi:transcription initiation factor TFIIB
LPLRYSLHDKGLSTIIGKEDYDVFRRKLPLQTRTQIWRLRKWQKRSRAYLAVDRNLARAMTELDRLCDKVPVPPPVKEKAAVIYRKFLDKGLIRGRSIAAIAAAALYIACRGTKTQRTLNEIAEASLVDKKDVSRCYRLILNELEIEVPVQDPILCISKIAGKVGITGKTQGVAIDILHRAKEKKLPAGKKPMGQAAAALYIACLQNNEAKKGSFVTQKDIAKAAGVTEVTVRNRYKTLKEGLNLVVP